MEGPVEVYSGYIWEKTSIPLEVPINLDYVRRKKDELRKLYSYILMEVANVGSPHREALAGCLRTALDITAATLEAQLELHSYLEPVRYDMACIRGLASMAHKLYLKMVCERLSKNSC